MKHLKKPLAFILALCMALSLAVPGFAEGAEDTADESYAVGNTAVYLDDEVTAEGDVGSVHWKLAGSVLTIYGDGSMGAYANSSSNRAPFYTDYRTVVTEVVIEDGVTDVGAYVFNGFSNLVKVTIPESVTEIGNGAFYQCTSLEEVNIAQSVVSFGQNVFYQCTALQEITIPAGASSFASNVFNGSGVNKVTFMGDAPDFSYTSLNGINGYGYYPAVLPGWTESVLSQSYGATITWTPMEIEGTYKDSLEQAIFSAEAKAENQYSETSWAAMQDALSTAVTDDENASVDQETVNNADTALRNAINALDPKMTVQVSNEAELRRILRDKDDYTANDTLKIELANDITLTESITDLRNPAAIIISGTNSQYSLTGSGDKAVFAPLNADYWKTKSIEFQNIEIDAKDQQFFVGYSINNSGNFTLDTVKLKNVRGTGTAGDSGITLYTGSGRINVVFKYVTTEGCTGCLFYPRRSNVEITNCELTALSYAEDEETTVAGRIMYIGSGSSSYWNDITVSDSTLTYEDPAEAGNCYLLYANTYTRVTLDGCQINGVNSNYAIYTTGNGSSSKNSLTIKKTVFSNSDGSNGEIRENNAYIDLTIYGDVTGDFVVRLGGSTPTGIILGSALQQDLKFYYGSSMSGNDPIVAKGSDDHPLDLNDVDKLVYTVENSPRSVEMSRESGETDICRLYRADFDECTTALLGSDPDSQGYVYSATAMDGKIEPTVQVTMKDGTELSSDQYTVAYYDANNVEDGDGLSVSPTEEAGSTKNAKVVISPTNDMAGSDVTIEYTIKVAAYTNLGAEGAPVSVQISFDENGDYHFEVYYNEYHLTEDEDFVVTGTYIDSEEYTLTFTIQGMGDYGGVYERTVEVPGRESKIRIVYDEETLDTALSDKVEQIYFSSNIIDLTAPVVVNYDVTINGEGFTLYAGTLESSTSGSYQQSILDVESGNVTLKNVKIDGQYQARLMYVGNGGNLELTDDTIATDTGYIEGESQGMDYAAAYIANGGTLTLGNCEVSEACRHYLNTSGDMYSSVPIENLGTLNVQEGAVLTHLFGMGSAIENAGTLNWTGGTFVVDSANSLSYSLETNTSYKNAIIYNTGTMNFSGGELNGYLLDENGNPTEERTSVLIGAISNYGGVLNMSGGIIQGFNTTGYDITAAGNSGTPAGYTVGGGGVFNRGTFNMTGGEIKNNISPCGGGVFNVRTFNMSGGIISDNEASQGGGVYNSSSTNGSSNPNINFYMTGGTISGNTLTGDSIKSEEVDPDIDDPYGFGGGGLSIYVAPAGSSVYISGGSNAEISGGTITDDSNVTVETTDEDGNTEEQSVSFGIAVSPVNIKSYSFSHNGQLVSHMDAGKLTITGSPNIETGIVLINFCAVTENVAANKAWLELDGALGTPLNITTLDEFLSSSSDSGSVNGSAISSIFYRINQDGDIVAGYKDRVTPDEDDGQWLQTGTSTYQTHEHFTISETVNMEGNTPDVSDEKSFDFDAWAICNHTAPLEYVPAEDPTCMETGNYEYWYCPTCYALFDENGQEISADDAGSLIKPKLSHDEIELTRITEEDATCEHIGYNRNCWQCPMCGKFFVDQYGDVEIEDDVIIPIAEHTYYIVPKVDATATEDGCTAYVICKVCGKQFTEPEVIPKGSEEEPDSSALEALVDATEAMTEKMNSSDYTADSWKTLQDALTNAKNVADNPDSTQDDVAAAMEALTAAINGLEPASGSGQPSTEDKIGFVQEGDEWHYYNSDGTRFTGTDIKEDTKKVVDGTDGWFYIENGKINFSCNSVEQNAYGWWYVLNGKVDFSYTGVANYSNAYGWWYISGGKVDFSKTGIEPNNYGWWRVVNGQVDFSCNSVEQNDYGWWYVSGGKVDFSKTSIEQNNYGWWRVVGGKVDFSCNSVEQNDYGWWYVVGGKVDFSYTGVANYANAYGWWYISGGKVDFSYTGRASNNYGTWNVVNGKVVF